ncbi:MAG: type II toxin-antitoxin system YafQ family toxin [Candidatus Rickettsiella isopodorum]|nr:type II toxin-antitoxin system YafQ family toxin [Candidatus Rickettsiella isopodorum]
MLTPIYTNKFDKDLKKITKAGNKNIEKFKTIIKKLINQEKLDLKHQDHKLIGNYSGRRECHIAPDWLLIYKIDGNNIIFERTGSHSELFS